MKIHLLSGADDVPRRPRRPARHAHPAKAVHVHTPVAITPPPAPTHVHCPSDGFCLGEPEDNALRHVTDAINDYTETLVPGAQLRFLTRLRDDVSARLRVLKT